jgi:NADH-quinone oxidoreductase subunit L
MALGLAALAGVPPLIGFFTKETVIDTAFEGVSEGVGVGAWLVSIALLVTVVLTAAYCTRAWFLLDGPPRGRAAAEPEALEPDPLEPSSGHGSHEPITLSAALSVAVLAVLTVIGTLFLTGLRGALHVGLLTALLSVLLIAGAVLAVWSLSRGGRGDAADRLPAPVRAGAERGFGADAAYVRVGAAVTALARLVVVLDRDVVDAYPRSTTVVARGLGRLGERSHRAIPSLALVGLVVGVGLVVALGVGTWR